MKNNEYTLNLLCFLFIIIIIWSQILIIKNNSKYGKQWNKIKMNVCEYKL
jgi:hypothetical protein